MLESLNFVLQLPLNVPRLRQLHSEIVKLLFQICNLSVFLITKLLCQRQLLLKLLAQSLGSVHILELVRVKFEQVTKLAAKLINAADRIDVILEMALHRLEHGIEFLEEEIDGFTLFKPSEFIGDL